MKKLLILLMLIIENIVFGVNTELTGNQEAVVKVEAEILAPLKLEIEDNVDFGIIMKGQPSKEVRNPGKLKITGEPNRQIKVSMKGVNETVFESKNEYSALLVKEGIGSQNANKNQKMTATLTLETLDNKKEKNNKMTLTKEGISIKVNGVIKVEKDQEEGIYNGKMLVRVEYVD